MSAAGVSGVAGADEGIAGVRSAVVLRAAIGRAGVRVRAASGFGVALSESVASVAPASR